MKIVISESTIAGAGRGLFAKKNISRGEIVCEYWGKSLSKDFTTSRYLDDPSNYLLHTHPYLRDLDESVVIMGEYDDNLKHSGVLVNDGAKLDDINDISNYLERSKSMANVSAVKMKDKLFYIASKRITKGNEIFASYGPGYWLLASGVSPERLPQILQRSN